MLLSQGGNLRHYYPLSEAMCSKYEEWRKENPTK